MTTVYDIESGNYGYFGVLTPKQGQALGEEMDRITGNLSKAWAVLYAKAAVAKAEAKAAIQKAKPAIDALRASKSKVLSGELASQTWGESAAGLARGLHALAVGLAEKGVAESLEDMDPVADLEAALKGPSVPWWVLAGGGIAALVLLPRIFKGRHSLSSWEPEDALE